MDLKIYFVNEKTFPHRLSAMIFGVGRKRKRRQFRGRGSS